MNIDTIIPRASVALGCFLAVCASTLGQEVHQADADRVPPAPEMLRAAAAPRGLQHSTAFRAGQFTRNLGALRAGQVGAADRAALQRFGGQRPAPTRVALTRSVGADRLALGRPGVLKLRQPDGTDVWLLAVHSPGATGLRLHLKEMDLGAGTATVYSETAEGVISRGPFTQRGPNGNGELWTAWLPGDKVYVEVSGAGEPTLEVAEVLHFDKDLSRLNADGVERAATCFEDVACFTVDEAVRDSVAQMNFTVGGGGFVCSGTILNDLDGETQVPYFLTAFHCLSTQPVVDTLEVVFFWQRPGCFGALPNYATLPRLNGGRLLTVNSTTPGNDMTFIRLNGDLPGGAGLAGWTTADPGAGSLGIHHPGGDFKRIHLMHLENNFNACNGLPHSQYHYFQLDQGNFAGGSSGSPALDANNRVVGQLFGDCPGGAVHCNNYPNWRAVYGKFSVTYPLIRRWLEVGGTIYVDRNYSGTEEGTPTRPFNTVTEGNGFAWDGARLKIRGGNYNEGRIDFTKRMTILAHGGAVTIGRP